MNIKIIFPKYEFMVHSPIILSLHSEVLNNNGEVLLLVALPDQRRHRNHSASENMEESISYLLHFQKMIL